MTKIVAICVALLLLAGCDQRGPNQKLRREIFMHCLEKAPAGPQVTKYNDWSEVVDSCASAAYYQSLEL